MKPNNQNNIQSEKQIYFCPYCHNMRIRVDTNIYTDRICDRCKSDMILFMSKEEFDKNSTEGKRKLISDLKAKYPEVATPTEVLLGKIYDNSRTIKNIIMFYFILTILGILIVFINMN